MNLELYGQAPWALARAAAGAALGEADVGAFSKQIELALFYDAKLEVAAS
jgi:hypothetical protein